MVCHNHKHGYSTKPVDAGHIIDLMVFRHGARYLPARKFRKPWWSISWCPHTYPASKHNVPALGPAVPHKSISALEIGGTRFRSGGDEWLSTPLGRGPS